MNTVYIMDTSFLLELNQIPKRFYERRIPQVKKTLEIVTAPDAKIHITVPILFEYARHMIMIDDREVKHKHITQLNEDIRSSLDKDSPWQVYGRDAEVLLKAEDVVVLSERFASAGDNDEGFVYSLADISIIQAKEQLVGEYDGIEILTFDKDLAKHSTSRECPLP